MILKKIISGGQTGADRAGLDVALALNLEHGGYCPKGRLSEDGSIPEKYHLTELGSSKYHYRTEKNVQESCATVIFTKGKLSRGSKLTLGYCQRYDKPCLHLDFNFSKENKTKFLTNFIVDYKVEVLNVAGQRLSSEKAIYKLSYDLLFSVFSDPY